MSVFHVAIVGGGAAGTLLALHLCRYPHISVTLYDRAGAFGRGVAYSATLPAHRLNVPARKMGGWHDDDKEELLRWLSRRRNEPLETVAARFIERSTYGDWLSGKLQELVKSGQARLESHEVVDLQAIGHRHMVCLQDGRQHDADATVLCTGNSFVRSVGRLAHHPHYIPKVWQPGALEPIRAADTVTIVGSGASGIDAVLELLDAGHQGRITLLSRRGLLPQPEATAQPCVDHSFHTMPTGLRKIVRLVRRQAEQAHKEGMAWQTVIDALLPYADPIWASSTLRERRQFLRHLRPYWMTFRHRADPAVLHRLRQVELDGRLLRIAGRLDGVEPAAQGFYIRISGRRERVHEHYTDWLLAAVGPEERIERHDSPLVKNLLAKGWAVPGPEGLGFAVSEEGRLTARDPAASGHRLYALGLPTRGTFWEVSSVPALRVRAAQMAQSLASLSATKAIYPTTINN